MYDVSEEREKVKTWTQWPGLIRIRRSITGLACHHAPPRLYNGRTNEHIDEHTLLRAKKSLLVQEQVRTVWPKAPSSGHSEDSALPRAQWLPSSLHPPLSTARLKALVTCPVCSPTGPAWEARQGEEEEDKEVGRRGAFLGRRSAVPDLEAGREKRKPTGTMRGGWREGSGPVSVCPCPQAILLTPTCHLFLPSPPVLLRPIPVCLCVCTPLS